MKTELLEALKYVAGCDIDQLNGMGICGNVTGYCRYHSIHLSNFSELYYQLKQLIVKWPKHSGDNIFPVPHPTKSPEFAYDTENPWDRSTEYGALRWELLEFCIAELEKELSDEQ